MASIRALILRAAGTNCDRETAHAFEKAGGAAEFVHIKELIARPGLLGEFRILVIPGGFTYGDDIASGKVLANQIRLNLRDELVRFVEAGNLVLGICNGFQVLVKARLLPRLDPGPAGQECTLTFNDSGKFEARWIHIEAVSGKSPFIAGGERLFLPVAHGEGKFVARSPEILDRLERNGQVIFRYAAPPPSDFGSRISDFGLTGESAGGFFPSAPAPQAGIQNPKSEIQNPKSPPYPWNPNGSDRAIAGICDETGRILGLMPHPERHAEGTQHPFFLREGLKEEGEGMKIFRNAVRYAEEGARFVFTAPK